MFRQRLSIGIGIGILASAIWSGPVYAGDSSPDYHVGEATRIFRPGIEREWRGAETKALSTLIWYPVDTDIPETPHDIGPPGRPIFHGHPAAIDGPISVKHPKYPLLLLSHGTGGSADSLDWLAAALAATGYIVAGVNHPGNNALEPLTREGFMLWWERAMDISEVLDGVLADPVLGSHIDAERIGAVGFSLGGYTVLELAGARTDVRAFEGFCRSPEADAICHPPEMNNLKDTNSSAALSPEAAESIGRSGASYADMRIKAVFAMAPALGEAFDPASLKKITIPIALIGGASDVTVPVETNIRRIGRFVPTASVALLPGATHYTFIDACMPEAADRMTFMCKDNPGTDRDAIHAETIERAKAFFGGALPAL
jgi:predicted dienelactone hydrolase